MLATVILRLETLFVDHCAIDTHVCVSFPYFMGLAKLCGSVVIVLMCHGVFAGANDEEAVSDSAVPTGVPPRSRKAHRSASEIHGTRYKVFKHISTSWQIAPLLPFFPFHSRPPSSLPVRCLCSCTLFLL